MGVVLDSSVPIAAERARGPVSRDPVPNGFDYRVALAPAAGLRRRYLDEIFAIIPVQPFTREKFTALPFGYSVCPCSVRHFQMIQGLTIQSL